MIFFRLLTGKLFLHSLAHDIDPNWNDMGLIQHVLVTKIK